jgi:hypothetical protein
MVNHGLHFAATDSWSWLIEYLVEVTGTFPSVSPLRISVIIECTTITFKHANLKGASIMYAYLYTQTLMLFFISSGIIGKIVVGLSTQLLKTSLKMGKTIL